MILASALGAGGFIWIIFGSIAGIFPRHTAAMWRLWLAVALSFVLVDVVIKPFVHRARPFEALPEITLGIMPGAGGTQRLPRFIGKAKAMDLVLTGRMMDAAEAERCGLVSRVVPLADLMTEALAVAAQVAAQPPQALRMAKTLLRQGRDTTFDQMLEMSAAMHAASSTVGTHRRNVWNRSST